MSPVPGLTPKMKDCLDFIRDFQTGHSFSPSYEEMMLGLGYHSKSNVHRLVSSLVRRGALIRLPNRARSLVVVEEGKSAAEIGLPADWIVVSHPGVPTHVWCPRDRQMYPLSWFSKREAA